MMKSDADMAGMATDLSVRISWLEDQVSQLSNVQAQNLIIFFFSTSGEKQE